MTTPLSSPVDTPFNAWGEGNFQNVTDSGEGLGPVPIYHQSNALHRQHNSFATWNGNDWGIQNDGQIAKPPIAGPQENAYNNNAPQRGSAEKEDSSPLPSNGHVTQGPSTVPTSPATTQSAPKAKWGDASGPNKRKATSRAQNSHSDDDKKAIRQRSPRKRNSKQMRTGNYNDSSSPGSSPNLSNAAANNNRTSHNLVEKQYRTRLNDQFDYLLSSIPSDLVGNHMNGPERGVRPEKRVSKADVLALAKLHIENLVKEKRKVEEENCVLKRRNKQLTQAWMSQNGGNALLNANRS